MARPRVAKIHTEAHRAEALGAKLLRVNDDDEDYFIVMQDPEGNEFCLTRSPALVPALARLRGISTESTMLEPFSVGRWRTLLREEFGPLLSPRLRSTVSTERRGSVPWA